MGKGHRRIESSHCGKDYEAEIISMVCGLALWTLASFPCAVRAYYSGMMNTTRAQLSFGRRSSPARTVPTGHDDKIANLEYWQPPITCCDDAWEKSYAHFETRGEEIEKFKRRLKTAGADAWPRDAEIVELFCGRGSGLSALEQMGFINLKGIDLSDALLSQYKGRARLYVGDCRELKLRDDSIGIVIAQGGLHHLAELPGDLTRVLNEVHRVLKHDGKLFFVEPWLTPFLRVVHAACKVRMLRWCWKKLDALAGMIQREQETYDAWLRQPALIRKSVHELFEPEREAIGWGKLTFVGRKKLCVGSSATAI
jgi:ubiquinone/menaquinone biosynthesis C-methylase UbiE